MWASVNADLKAGNRMLDIDLHSRFISIGVSCNAVVTQVYFTSSLINMS